MAKSVMEQLKERKEAEAAAKVAEQVDEKVLENITEANALLLQAKQAESMQAAMENQISAGIMSTANLHASVVGEDFKMPPEQVIHEVLAEPELPKGPVGSYRAVRLNRFADPSGVWIYPVDGFFIPKNDWERAELEHFAKQYSMVELQEASEEDSE